MKGLTITKDHLQKIRRHGRDIYPEECCGALLGRVSAQGKVVYQVQPINNSFDGIRNNRFLITPETYKNLDRKARRQGLDVLGFYHSHPDCPAVPSDFDRDHAWPWYSYIIISVEAGRPSEINNWRLKEDRSGFDREDLRIAQNMK